MLKTRTSIVEKRKNLKLFKPSICLKMCEKEWCNNPAKAKRSEENTSGTTKVNRNKHKTK